MEQRRTTTLAAAVEKDFPGKVVETLAYQWTRQRRRRMRPRPNVRRASLLHRVLLSHAAGDLATAREIGLSRRSSGLVEGLPAALDLD